MKNKALTSTIAGILCAVMAIGLPLQSYAAASGNEQYLSDIKTVSGKEAEADQEYRINYQAGDLKAITAHDLLNKFYDDDTGSQIGDFLLDCGLEYGARDEIETIFLQGNSELILAIQQVLGMAVDPAADTFLDRMQNKTYDDMLDE